jgi:hypothetical protein
MLVELTIRKGGENVDKNVMKTRAIEYKITFVRCSGPEKGLCIMEHH